MFCTGTGDLLASTYANNVVGSSHMRSRSTVLQHHVMNPHKGVPLRLQASCVSSFLKPIHHAIRLSMLLQVYSAAKIISRPQLARADQCRHSSLTADRELTIYNFLTSCAEEMPSGPLRRRYQQGLPSDSGDRGVHSVDGGRIRGQVSGRNRHMIMFSLLSPERHVDLEKIVHT